MVACMLIVCLTFSQYVHCYNQVNKSTSQQGQQVNKSTSNMDHFLKRTYSGAFHGACGPLDGSRCSYTTSNGHQCFNYSKTEYNGAKLCNVHLNTVKAEEECCICLCPKDKPGMRIKLACGHHHHISCLGQMEEITCPICRTEMNAAECSKIFTPTRAKPLMDRVFGMNGTKQKMIFGIISDMITYLEGIDDKEEVDIFKSYISNYFSGTRFLNEARNEGIITESAGNIMYDWVDVMHGAIFHIRRYGTYNGFNLASNGGTIISWDSAAPPPSHTPPVITNGPVPFVPQAMNLPPPVNTNAPLMGYANPWPTAPVPYSPTIRSPSPVMRWWAH